MLFRDQCRYAGLPIPAEEFRFHSTRRWRFDYVWQPQKVALEVQGGLFMGNGGGRHSRGGHLRKEHEKINEAAILGYRVLFVMPEQIQDGSALTLVERALRG